MFLSGVNRRVTAENLLRGIIVQSGNDACIVIAEGLAGSEEAFADEMNSKAAEIGLKNSQFKTQQVGLLKDTTCLLDEGSYQLNS